MGRRLEFGGNSRRTNSLISTTRFGNRARETVGGFSTRTGLVRLPAERIGHRIEEGRFGPHLSLLFAVGEIMRSLLEPL